MTSLLNILGFMVAAAAVALLVAVAVLGPPTTWFEWLAFAVALSFGMALLLIEPEDVERWRG